MYLCTSLLLLCSTSSLLFPFLWMPFCIIRRWCAQNWHVFLFGFVLSHSFVESVSSSFVTDISLVRSHPPVCPYHDRFSTILHHRKEIVCIRDAVIGSPHTEQSWQQEGTNPFIVKYFYSPARNVYLVYFQPFLVGSAIFYTLHEGRVESYAEQVYSTV